MVNNEKVLRRKARMGQAAQSSFEIDDAKTNTETSMLVKSLSSGKSYTRVARQWQHHTTWPVVHL